MANPNWKKGVSGNPTGRPGLAPELRSSIESNKAALKALILHYFNMSEAQITFRQQTPDIPFLEKIIGQCFEKTANDGNVDALRKLLEIVFGKIPEEPKEFDLSEEERELILTFRERQANAIESSRRIDSTNTEEKTTIQT